MDFTRQSEYDLRTEFSTYIKANVETYLDKFSQNYKNKIGYFIQYPLILLESLFESAYPEYYRINTDRHILSWFILEMKNRLPDCSPVFVYDVEDYNDFKGQYSNIKKVYSDLQYSLQLSDMFSISKIALLKNDLELSFKKPILSDEYADVGVYYLGLDDKKNFNEESEAVQKVVEYLHNYYPYFKKIRVHPFLLPEKKYLSQLKGLTSNFDIRLLELCFERVKQDTKKLGGNIKSQLIENYETLNKILGILFYLGQVTLYRYKAFDAHHRFNLEDTLITFDYEWLINKIEGLTLIPSVIIERYINYFVLDSGGTLTEFPLIKYQGKIHFVPSSTVLNDWQFSLVNGHYFRNIIFTNRDTTISSSIINELIKNVQMHSNIRFIHEKYYEFGTNGEKDNSDIDFAIYDIESNELLVIECKWKDNVYLPSEDFVKITRTINEIYNKQLDKHKAFLEMSKGNIDLIFNKDPDVVKLSEKVSITYIALDKRVQFHLGGKHLLPIYTMMHLLEKFSNGKKLYLRELINEIGTLKTNVCYEGNCVTKLRTSKKIEGTEYEINLCGVHSDYL